MEDHTEGAQGVRTSVPQYDIRMTGQKESATYCERHCAGELVKRTW